MSMLISRTSAEIKRQRSLTSSKQNFSELEVGSLDALATAAAFGDAVNQATASETMTTTRHPRHRPGCTCIVCIQPPSGKGPKHHPNCTCNVCMTVKRRFKTLMLRKKKRQSEREEAEANKRLVLPWGRKEEIEGSSTSLAGLQPIELQKESNPGSEPLRTVLDDADAEKGRIDLNCHPERDGEQHAAQLQSLSRVSMMSLFQVASLPLVNYLKQNGLSSLACEQQVSSSSVTVPQAMPVDESEERTPDEADGSTAQEQDASVDEVLCSPNNDKSDAS